MPKEEKKVKSIVSIVKNSLKSEPPDKYKGTSGKEEIEDGEIRDLAIAEIEKEAKIAKIRGQNFGTWHCALRKTNKNFLNRAIEQTLSHNKREEERHKSRSSKKLDQLDRYRERNPIEKYEDGRHLVRNPFVRRTRKEMGMRYADIEYARYKNARRKAEKLPPREPPVVKFVKPNDLDDRVLIPGQPKKAKVKKIEFVAPVEEEEKFLGHDGRDLQMERIRQKLSDKIPKQTFVPAQTANERFFHLCGDKVAGLIRSCDQ